MNAAAVNAKSQPSGWLRTPNQMRKDYLISRISFSFALAI